jgi:hypothetical protein
LAFASPWLKLRIIADVDAEAIHTEADLIGGMALRDFEFH